MTTSGGKNNFQHRLRRWLDDCRLALSGIILATRSPRFLVTFFITFAVFGTIMNLLSGSTASLNLFWVTDLAGKLDIIAQAFLGLFGLSRGDSFSFWSWLLVFTITLLQSVLIGLVVFVWQHQRHSRRAQVAATAANADHIQHASFAAGLAILGSGCPTCGTTLLMPLLGTLFSTSSYMLASLLSGVLTFAAILLALFSLRRLGREAYIMVVSEQYQRRKRTSQEEKS